MICRTATRCAFAIAATLLLSLTANAQLFRAYLASDGNDANPCTLPAPCRLLPTALNAVASGGEIWMLDSANYNTSTVTVGKSVSILAVPGAVGSVLAIGGPAISITAAGLTVALRNLVIVPLAGGGGTNGVSMTAASTLAIEDSLFANLPSDGVRAVGAGTVKIASTTLRNILGYAVSAENGTNVSISGSKMLGNGSGGVRSLSSAAATTTAVVSDSIVSGGQEGIYALSYVAGATARIFVTRCTIENINYALDSETLGVGSAQISVSNSMIAKNNYAWYQNGIGSVLESSGNNHIRGNANNFGTLTNVGLQ